MSRRPTPLAMAAVLAAVLFTVFFLAGEARRSPDAVLLGLVPEEVQAVAARSGYPAEDLWERAQTIGVGAAVLRVQSLSALMERAEALHFSRAETEKWKVMGLVAPSAPLKADSLWIRDAAVFAQIAGEARLRGIPVSTQAVSGSYVVHLPEELDPKALPIGFDPQSLRFARARALIPIFLSQDPGDLLAAAAREIPSATAPPLFLLSSEAPSPEKTRELFAAIDKSGGWLGVTDRTARPGWTPLWRAIPRRALIVRNVDPQAGMSPVWRSLRARAAGALIVHLSPDRGVEENLDRLRDVAARLRAAGLRLGLPEKGIGGVSLSPGQLRLRYLLALLFAWVAPLFSLRRGLHAVRRARSGGRWPQASPVRETLAGMGAAAGASAAIGLLAHALLSAREWRLGLLAAQWSLWMHSLPFLLGAWALYTLDFSKAARWLKNPVTYLGALRIMAAAAFTGLLLAPRYLVGRWGWEEWLGRWGDWPGALWWVSLRWRETLVGWPCLFVGLWRHCRSLEASAGRAPKSVEDSRPWLLVGLLGPVGVLQVLGLARLSFWLVLAQTAWALTAGVVIGGLLVAGLALCRKLSRSR